MKISLRLKLLSSALGIFILVGTVSVISLLVNMEIKNKVHEITEKRMLSLMYIQQIEAKTADLISQQLRLVVFPAKSIILKEIKKDRQELEDTFALYEPLLSKKTEKLNWEEFRTEFNSWMSNLDNTISHSQSEQPDKAQLAYLESYSALKNNLEILITQNKSMANDTGGKFEKNDPQNKLHEPVAGFYQRRTLRLYR